VRQAVLDRAVRLRQPLLPGAAGARPRAAEVVALGAAVASGVAAAIHAAAIGPHLEESRLFAAAFAGMAVGQGGWMVLIIVGPSRRRYLAGAGLNGAIALTWLLSRTVGLPVGPEPWVAEPVGPMDAVATLAGLLAVLGSLVLALKMKPGGTQLPTRIAASVAIRVGFGLLASGFVASVVPPSPGAHGFGSHACCGPAFVGHLIILAGMLATLAGVFAVAVRGGTRPSTGRRTS
jgi:hypothetical protein